MVVKRFDVWLTALDPTVGSEIRKTRPCLVVSPDEMNRQIATVVIAPLTSGEQSYRSRVDCNFKGRDGQIAVDQLRAVDKSRLIKRLGELDRSLRIKVFEVLAEFFSE